jgi:hypothetical protein
VRLVETLVIDEAKPGLWLAWTPIYVTDGDLINHLDDQIPSRPPESFDRALERSSLDLG